ncbi:hypothetical protein J4030_15100 [Allobranchiibius sp. CTAmp26]|nr:hypothetical protein [Allobranchiibius sp. CTAmp26]
MSEHYDDVLVQISARIAEEQSVGKAEIGALVLWKRVRASSRWTSELMALSDTHIRDVTGAAVCHVLNTSITTPEAASAGRTALSTLPGFRSGDALASAVLFAAAPARMAVYDRRAQVGLEMLGLSLPPKRGRYGAYMALVEQLSGAVTDSGTVWRARDVDLALFWLGRSLRAGSETYSPVVPS